MPRRGFSFTGAIRMVNDLSATCVKISRPLARSATDFLEDDIRTVLEAADCAQLVQGQAR